jgi:formylglycine-generating enzyme required for sulfatase activity
VSIKRRHKQRIGRTFSIAANPVTLAQYRQFIHDYSPPEEVGGRTADLPVVAVSWFQAVAYCNWLSKEEGIPEDQWCYKIANDETILKDQYLSLKGYRLPTEAETEYATQAGATTARYYGEMDELLDKYAWYQKNSRKRPQPVGRLKPNDLGLFDMHGNVFTWFQERLKKNNVGGNGELVEDQEDEPAIIGKDRRGCRGGAFNFVAASVYRSVVLSCQPTSRDTYIGFRLARTIGLVLSNSPKEGEDKEK